MVSDGDPALVFGPMPGEDGTFSWSNGSRLYYTNLTSASSVSETAPFPGFEAITVSRMDVPASVDTVGEAGTLVANEASWADPVIVSKQNPTVFSDKEQMWADQNEDSPFFGNAYICWAGFRSLSQGNAAPTPLRRDVELTAVTAGPRSRSPPLRTTPSTRSRASGGRAARFGPTARGVVYVMAQQFAVGTPGVGKHILIKSFNGGKNWNRPQELFDAVDACFAVQFDGTSFRCVMDGVGGARDDLSASPSLDIASATGAPTSFTKRGRTDGPEALVRR